MKSFFYINVNVKFGLVLLWQIKSYEGVRALSGYFGPLYSKKLKVAFHQFHLTCLLEEKPKSKILTIYFTGCYGNQNV